MRRKTPWYRKKSVSLDKARSGSVVRTDAGLFRIRQRPACGKGYIIEFYPKRKPAGSFTVLEKGKWKNFNSITEVRKAINRRK